MRAVWSGGISGYLLCYWHVINIGIVPGVYPLGHNYLGIGLKYLKFLTGIDLLILYIRGTVPLLNDPL